MDFELSEEHKMFQAMLHDFVVNEIEPCASEWDETDKFPYDMVKKMAELGLYSVGLPEEYGGTGDELTFAIAAEEVSRGSGGLGISYLVTLGLAMYPITMHGSHEQKARYIPRVIDGATVAFALTEPMAGSDVANLDTRYEKDGDSFILNGSKIFITSGAEADFVTTFATKDKSLGHKGISAFIVEKGTPGFSVGKLEHKMGIHPASAAELIFDNCRIPAENLISEEGKGFRIALEAIDASQGDYCRAGGRHRTGSLRSCGRLLQGAQAVRRGDSPPPGHTIHDCRHGGRTGCSATAHLQSRVAHRAIRQVSAQGGCYGEALRQ